MDIQSILNFKKLGVIQTETFSDVYPHINDVMFNSLPYQESRDGKVKEMLDIKTQLLNPYRRCVGGMNRNINIFFLLAEAMWIATGKKDVKFLTLFNKKMKDFSDDGKIFHAPYGYRLRHWGIRSEDNFLDSGLQGAKGYDQVIDAIKILSENPNSRQVVMSIWNPSIDLGYKTKDIPCNDLIMLKIRDGKLITTIQNRSNDLHWGLPTNIFQFSFLTELIANSLGVELGTQTHNSQSLHIYEWNDIAKRMSDDMRKWEDNDPSIVWSLYDDEVQGREERMDFNFSHELPVNRFREIEIHLNLIIKNLTNLSEGKKENEEEIEQIRMFSSYLYYSYLLLRIYLNYKHEISKCSNDLQKDTLRYRCMSDIEVLDAEITDDQGEGVEKPFNWDISILAKNFFASRLSKPMNHRYLGKL